MSTSAPTVTIGSQSFTEKAPTTSTTSVSAAQFQGLQGVTGGGGRTHFVDEDETAGDLTPPEFMP